MVSKQLPRIRDGSFCFYAEATLCVVSHQASRLPFPETVLREDLGKFQVAVLRSSHKMECYNRLSSFRVSKPTTSDR